MDAASGADGGLTVEHFLSQFKYKIKTCFSAHSSPKKLRVQARNNRKHCFSCVKMRSKLKGTD